MISSLVLRSRDKQQIADSMMQKLRQRPTPSVTTEMDEEGYYKCMTVCIVVRYN
jgi:hypothetical protein